jgi:hypothetical protein
MHPLEIYLEELAALRGATTKETSGYPALTNLFNSVGHSLKPKVRCFIHPKNSGAGLPDGGLFTPDQLKNSDEEKPLYGVPLPSRGVVEVKSTGDELEAIAKTKQVADYLEHYGLLLLTNYRDFQLLKRSKSSKPVALESFKLASDEKSFWQTAAHPRKAANETGERFLEYLKRVLLHAAPLNNPRDVAFFLASYARDARVRVEAAKDLPALAAVRTALEEALGMKFEADKGEHFFRSTLVQTLFYGVFSAWVLWHKENPARKNDFDWRSAAWTLHVPMIKALFEQVATPTKLGPLGLVEVLDWSAAALNRVERPGFFARFVEDHAVQYFYEPFLEAFDPELRKELGVWYTPPEIVQYQVARVDTALREELDIPDGLADPRVFVLDPCCGTGAYLVEVLKRIEQTLKEHQGEDALAVAELKEAAQKRVFGFEIMPAPFVVAHLQMGLLFQNLGVPLDDSKSERAGIFLTNALTGWDENKENPYLANWPELEAERRGAGKVKQEKPILVILGNPPYNAYAGVSPKEELGLVEVYKGIYWTQKKNKKGEDVFDEDGQPVTERHYKLSDSINKGGWGIKKFNLDELYVRFFRLAERRIAERTGKGIVSFISNHSWISDPSFVILRQHLLDSFDHFWIENMHGNRKISEYAPDGRTSETIFAIAGFSPGIRQGTAISLWVKNGKKEKKSVLFRDDLNDAKAAGRRARLLESLKQTEFNAQYEKAEPTVQNRFNCRPSKVASHYLEWPTLIEICAEPPSNGLMEKRGSALIDIDRTALERRMRDYYDPNVSWEELKALETGLTEDAARFGAKGARKIITEAENFRPDHLLRYALRPCDTRWCYYSSKRPLWNEPRPALWQQCWKGNSFLMSRPAGVANPEGLPLFYTSLLGDNDFLRGHAYYFPLRLRSVPKTKPKKKDDGNGEFGSILEEAAPAYKADEQKTSANLSASARAYLAKLGIANSDDDVDTAALIWMHTLAIGFSPAYLAENTDGVRENWPRIPLPDAKNFLLASAELGKKVAAFLNTETAVAGIDAGKIHPELVKIAVVTRLTKQPLNLSLTARWGHAGKDGVTMPGKGKLETRAYTAEELAALSGGASVLASRSTDDKTARQEPRPTVTNLLGQSTHDVFLNDTTCWRNVPEKVWDYTIGGYQVIKKWLSYREHELLGRALTPDEAREVTHMARRIAALILLQPELDKNYQAVKAATFDWKQ